MPPPIKRADPVDEVVFPHAGGEGRAERARGIHRRARQRPDRHDIEGDSKPDREGKNRLGCAAVNRRSKDHRYEEERGQSTPLEGNFHKI